MAVLGYVYTLGKQIILFLKFLFLSDITVVTFDKKRNKNLKK